MTTPGSGAVPAGGAPRKAGGRELAWSERWGTLAAVGLSGAAVVADFMAVAVALPSIQRSTSASFPQVEWVLEAYVLALATFLLVSGYLSDRLGGRSVFLAGLAVFAIGSVVAFATNSPYALIWARAGQGAGAALLLPAGAVLLPEALHGGRERLALTIWSSATGLAVAASPVLGGLVTEELGWHYVFVFEAVAATLALVVGALSVRAAPPRNPRRTGGLDWLGLCLFAAAIAILVAGLVRTTANLDGWSDTGVLACLAATGLLLAAFVAVEAVANSPVLDISLFRRRTFSGATAAAFGVSMAVLGPFLLLVLYLSNDLGHSPLGTGVRLLALSGVTLPLLLLGEPLRRLVPAKTLVFGGLALVAGGLYVASRLTPASGWVDLVPGMIVAGAGLEVVNPRLGEAAAAAVEPHLVAAAYRTNSTLRQLGVATGVAVSGSVFATRLTNAIGQQIPATGRASGQQGQLASLVLAGHVQQAAAQTGQGVVKASFVSALHEVLLVAALVALACALLSLVLRSADVPRAAWTAQAARTLPAQRAARAPTKKAELVKPAARPPTPAPLLATPSPVRQGPSPPHPTLPAQPRRQMQTARTQPGQMQPRDQEVTLPNTNEPAEEHPFEPAEEHPSALPRRSPGAPPTGLPPVPVGSTGLVVEGMVSAATGEAVPGAKLALVGLMGERAGETATSEDGSFTVPAPGPGNYTLVATAPGYRATARVVKPGKAPVKLVLLGVGSVSGRVSRADASPLEADVVLRAPDGTTVMEGRSGADGTFLFAEVLEGSYELVASSGTYKAESLAVSVTRGGASRHDISLSGVGHIYGAVSGEGGAWLPGVTVFLAVPSGEVVSETKTDDAGSYQFREIPAGVYLLTAGGSEVLLVQLDADATVTADLSPATSPAS